MTHLHLWGLRTAQLAAAAIQLGVDSVGICLSEEDSSSRSLEEIRVFADYVRAAGGELRAHVSGRELARLKGRCAELGIHRVLVGGSVSSEEVCALVGEGFSVWRELDPTSLDEAGGLAAEAFSAGAKAVVCPRGALPVRLGRVGSDAGLPGDGGRWFVRLHSFEEQALEDVLSQRPYGISLCIDDLQPQGEGLGAVFGLLRKLRCHSVV